MPNLTQPRRSPGFTAITTAVQRASIQLVVGRVANAASTYVGLLVIAVVAGFAVRGQVDIMLQAGAGVAVLSGLGGPGAMAYYVARRQLSVRPVLSWYVLSVLLSVAGAAVVSVFRDAIGLGTENRGAIFLAVLAIAVGFNTFAATSHVSIALGLALPILLGQLVAAGLYFAVVFIVVLHQVSGTAIVAGFGVSNLVAGYLIRRKLLDWRRNRLAATVSLIALLRYGLRSVVGEVGVSASLRGDILLVAALKPVSDVGRYGTALLLMESTLLVTSALGAMVLTGLTSAPDEEERMARFSRYRRGLVGTTVLVAVPAVAFGFLLQTSYFPNSQLGVLCLLLAPGYIVWVAGAMSGVYLASRAKPGTASLGYIAGAVTMLAVDLLLVPRFGIKGAAIGSSIGYGASALFLTAVQLRIARSGVPHEVQ